MLNLVLNCFVFKCVVIVFIIFVHCFYNFFCSLYREFPAYFFITCPVVCTFCSFILFASIVVNDSVNVNLFHSISVLYYLQQSYTIYIIFASIFILFLKKKLGTLFYVPFSYWNFCPNTVIPSGVMPYSLWFACW